MFEVKLFLGCPVDSHLEAKLNAIDPQVMGLFINSSDYLSEVTYNDVRFLGKYASETSGSGDLTLLQNNIYSILKKILPEHPFEDQPLVLFPAVSPDQLP